MIGCRACMHLWVSQRPRDKRKAGRIAGSGGRAGLQLYSPSDSATVIWHPSSPKRAIARIVMLRSAIAVCVRR
eukprot:9454012-Pyramimonas_sp.AAC.1